MKLLNYFEIFFIIYLIKINSINGQQKVGDFCTITTTRQSGVCKLLQECRTVMDELRFKGKRPTTCGFLNLQSIVCCPVQTASNTTKTTPLTDAEKMTKRHKKCVEYSDAVYEYITAIGLSTTGETLKPKTDRCGHTAIPLIVGGSPASPREFPHSALLGYDNGDGTYEWDCGGSLVSRRFVLTAGHCLYSRDRGAVKRVRLGDLNLNSDTDDAKPKEFVVMEIIKHPDYVITSQYNDIALLKLDKDVELSPYIRPICLPVRQEIPQHAIATGWGRVEWSGSTSNTLLKVTLDMFSHKECNESYMYNINRRLKDGIIDSSQICAGSHTEAKDTCQGDSGGPLQIYHTEIYCMYMQIGITSFGKGCGAVNVPGVYTRVWKYVDWIENTIWPSNQPTFQ